VRIEPRLERPTRRGGATVRLYGDLGRHAMGRLLADPARPRRHLRTSDLAPLKWDGKPVMIPADTFLTPEAVGRRQHRAVAASPTTAPGTLKEAVLLHGEDAPQADEGPARSKRARRSARATRSAKAAGAGRSGGPHRVPHQPQDVRPPDRKDAN
jgi:hypothetical protein